VSEHLSEPQAKQFSKNKERSERGGKRTRRSMKPRVGVSIAIGALWDAAPISMVDPRVRSKN